MPPPVHRTAVLFLVFVLASCSSLHSDRARMAAMDRAHLAWQQVVEKGTQPQVLAAYRAGVETVLKELSEVSSPDEWPAAVSLGGGWTVKIDQGAKNFTSWNPRLFDQLDVPAGGDSAVVKESKRHGLGLPLDGVRVDNHEDAQSKFLYGETQHLPVTAVIEFSGQASKTREATLHLYDPREMQSITIEDRKIPLAADFATPAQQVLSKRSFVRRALGGLFRPERFMEEKSLFIQEPYRADKIPVIFVHGLASDPHIWQNEVTAIMSDPELGRRVQCWCFLYPTALTLPASAARLRENLAVAQKTFDPDDNDPGLRKMMLVGHSMGGLISRMQVIDSGDDFWRTWFTVPPEKLPLDGEILGKMKESLFFTANPRVKRVVFIATPHRGSQLADGWIGRLGASLIKVPMQAVQLFTSIATLDVELLNPDRLTMKRMGATSINGLATTHPVLAALAKRPLKTSSHSIIAVIKEKPKLEETSDGVVPYVSSHLREAKTEVTVKSGHSCTDKPDTVRAVVRLVRRHLGLD